ncbi:MAG: hypothetical protein ACTH0S_06625 [Senegalia sp. (in: firmicutes)]
MKNSKIAKINTTRKKLFKDWLHLTKIFHGLTKQQIDILSLFLYHYNLLKKEITNEKILNKVLFDYSTKMKVKEELGIKDPALQNAMTSFRKKGIIIDGKLSKLYIPNLEDNSNTFNLVFKLNIIDEE